MSEIVGNCGACGHPRYASGIEHHSEDCPELARKKAMLYAETRPATTTKKAGVIMNKQEWYDFQEKVFADMMKLTRAKNDDYTAGSDDAFANFRLSEDVGVPALQGLVVRMADKWQRVRSYFNNGELKVEGEGIEDAFRDLIGYSTLALGMIEELKVNGEKEKEKV